MATIADAPVTSEYRVTSVSEAGNDNVSINFVEILAEGSQSSLGSFARVLKTADAAAFFPGQVYTVTLTKKA